MGVGWRTAPRPTDRWEQFPVTWAGRGERPHPETGPRSVCRQQPRSRTRPRCGSGLCLFKGARGAFPEGPGGGGGPGWVGLPSPGALPWAGQPGPLGSWPSTGICGLNPQPPDAGVLGRRGLRAAQINRPRPGSWNRQPRSPGLLPASAPRAARGWGRGSLRLHSLGAAWLLPQEVGTGLAPVLGSWGWRGGLARGHGWALLPPPPPTPGRGHGAAGGWPRGVWGAH